MSRRRKTKDLRIRVIGWVDPADLAAASPSSLPAGSVQTLTLDDLLQSQYTDEYCNEQQPLWIQVENASGKDLERIGAHFGLHPLTVEAVQTRHTREKLEIFQNYLFLVFHALHGGSQMGGGAEYTARDRGRDTRQQRPADGTFAAAAAGQLDPYGIARALAGERPIAPPADRPLEHVHEGSALLTGNDKVSAKYYGADPSMSHSIHPSPAPPRRHKSALSLPAGQMPSMSPSASYGNRAGGLTAAGGAVTPSAAAGSAFAFASSGAAAASALPPEPLSVAIPPTSPANLSDRFRYFPEQVLMPGSPQSVSSYDSTPVHTDDSDSDDSEDSRSDAASASATSEHSTRTSPTPRSTNHHILAREVAKTLAAGDSSDSTAVAASSLSPPTAASLLSDREPLRTAPIKLVVFPHIVLSFHSSGLETVASVARRLDRVYASNVESTAWIIHALLDSITDSLLPVVNGTAMEVDALEELIYVLSGSEHRDLLKRMGMTRRRLSFLRQRLWSKRDILMSLIGKDWQMFLAGVQIPYLRDVYDHVVTMLHKVEAASDTLVALQNTYLANVQIDVAEASNDMNTVMKNLTAVGAIILPLQLVASLWGMNCDVPFQAIADWSDPSVLVPFLSVCFGMLFVTLFMTFYFKKHNLM